MVVMHAINVDHSRVTESAYVPEDRTSIIDKTLFESSMPIFVAYSQFLCGTSVIVNELVE